MNNPNPMLSRDYEVPKKSMFLLEGDELVQSRDATAYISNSVTDSVMYGTNGNLGLRHRSEMDTVSFKTGVMLNGVYHVQPRESVIRCSALSTEYHTGAAICTVDMDCRIDGESGTLSSVPVRRLSLADGAYRSSCEDVTSSDGHVVFDCDYVRTVGTTDLSEWGAEVRYHNFRIDADMPTSSDAGSGPGIGGVGGGGGGYNDDVGSPWANSCGGYGFTSRSTDSADGHVQVQGSPKSYITPEPWRVELTVSFSIELGDWEVLTANQMDEVWQRSVTSKMLVSSMTDSDCVISFSDAGSDPASNYGGGGNGPHSLLGDAVAADSLLSSSAGACTGASGGGVGGGDGTTSRRIPPEVDIVTCVEDVDGNGAPRNLQRYTTSAFVEGAAFVTSEGEESGNGGGGDGATGARSMNLSNCGGGNSGPLLSGRSAPSNSNRSGFGERVGSVLSSVAGSPNRTGQSRSFLVRKRFVFNLTTDNVPTSVVLTFRARHVAGNNYGNTVPRPAFSSIDEMINKGRRSLDRFWHTHDFDLQLQEELVPNRTKLALRYNVFRLFGVSANLENGLSKSGCSCSGDALQYDLRQYLYHGFYYLLTDPVRCLSLLRFLYRLLPQARENARRLSVPSGAVYPECTITGVNTKFYTNILDARFHVNADVGFLIHVHNFAVDTIVREDRIAMLEMMLETARIWLHLGEWRNEKTEFHLDNLAGVDEYNANGNGSFYIHLAAMHHMSCAAQLVESEEKIIGVDQVNRVLDAIGMTRAEVGRMRAASKAIALPRDEHAGAYMVHDNFDALTPWSRTERAKHPLSLNYHPLAIFRHKIVDVPEVLLGMIVHEWLFDRNDFERNLSYYAPLCTLDNPEALALLAISLCRARANFAQPIPLVRALLHLDMDNILYVAEEGLHFGAMSAGMLAFMVGVGGLSLRMRCLYLNPLLPAGVDRYCFTVCWRGAVVKASLNRDELEYELVSGESVRFIHGVAHNRIHLHTGFRRCTSTQRISIPRRNFCHIGQFDGAIFLSDCLFENLLEYSYVSWLRTLEVLFENYRTLHQRAIPPLTPEEFIMKVVYQREEEEIAFSGIHSVLLDRGVNLDLGTPDDAEIVETRFGLANAKVAEMAELLAQHPPKVNPDLFRLISGLAHSGVACAIVTYSRSLKLLMQHSSELANFFVARIDGEEAHDRRIRGRPHLDLFLRAAEKIHVEPSRCLVISHHLDRDYSAESFAHFRMFLDIDDPFVSSRVAPNLYPTLDDDTVARLKRDNPVVCRLELDKIPETIDQLEDIIEGRPCTERV